LVIIDVSILYIFFSKHPPLWNPAQGPAVGGVGGGHLYEGSYKLLSRHTTHTLTTLLIIFYHESRCKIIFIYNSIILYLFSLTIIKILYYCFNAMFGIWWTNIYLYFCGRQTLLPTTFLHSLLVLHEYSSYNLKGLY